MIDLVVKTVLDVGNRDELLLSVKSVIASKQVCRIPFPCSLFSQLIFFLSFHQSQSTDTRTSSQPLWWMRASQ